jgi:hypothetical protein
MPAIIDNRAVTEIILVRVVTLIPEPPDHRSPNPA